MPPPDLYTVNREAPALRPGCLGSRSALHGHGVWKDVGGRVEESDEASTLRMPAWTPLRLRGHPKYVLPPSIRHIPTRSRLSSALTLTPEYFVSFCPMLVALVHL